MKTVAVFFADGFEMIEALTPVDYLRRCGVNVITVSVPFSVEGSRPQDLINPYEVISSGGVVIKTDMTLFNYLEKFGTSEQSSNENVLPDAVVCPGGGNGAKNLSLCSQLLEYLEKCFDSGKIVAAICASPAVVLGKTKILKNKKWTCFPGMKDCALEEILSSSTHLDATLPNNRVVQDGTVLTSAAAGCSEEFALKLCKMLCETSEENAKVEQVEKSCLVR